jgi:hypothetical protein
MKPKSNSNDPSAAADEILKKLYLQARAQFGDAIQYHWFYDGDLCPACAGRSIDVLKYEGQDALSVNAFIYRARGVLIGYFLCAACARQIFQSAKVNPYHQTPLHAEIERNLIAAYHNHLKHLNA